MMRERNLQLDLLRCAAILGVLVAHTTLFRLPHWWWDRLVRDRIFPARSRPLGSLMMKKLLLILLLLTPVHVLAQYSIVNATVTDTDRFLWTAGSYKIEFVPNPSNPKINAYMWSGGNLQQNSLFTGTLDPKGSFTVSIPSNNAIVPSGSQWKFSICPNATTGCFVVNTPANTPTLNLTSLLSTHAQGPRFPVTASGYGYGTVEVSPRPQPGAIFLDVTDNTCHQWATTAWQTCGTRGGGGGGGTGGIEPSKYGAVTDAQSSKTGSISSGSSILNCSSCVFTLADVDKTISVEGASNTSADQPIVTTISAVNSSTQVLLNASATATVSSTGVIWGTDNFNAFQTWLNSIPAKNATISGGAYLINLNLYQRELRVSSNTAVTMARGSKIYSVGATLTTGPSTIVFPGLFKIPQNVRNVQFKNMNISGEYQNTNVSAFNGNGYGGDCMFVFELGGASARHFQLTDSYISNIYGNVVKEFNSNDTDVQILDNSVVSTGDTPFNVNSAQTTISRNYIDQKSIPTGVGTDGIEASGANSHYDNNILVSVTGQYALAVGGVTGGGPPYVGTTVNGNLILNPRTPAGGISIADGFTHGEISNNLILGVNTGSGIINQQSGSILTGNNTISNNRIHSNSGNAIGISNAASGNLLSGNVTSGTFYGLSLTGGNITSNGNTWYGSIHDIEMSGAIASVRDKLSHGTYHLSAGAVLSPDSILYAPSGIILQPPFLPHLRLR